MSKLGMTVVAGGAAAAFALYSRAAWPWVGLGFVALAPWLVALDRVATLRGAFAAGLVMAVAFELAVFGWFALAITDYTGAPALVHLAVLALASPALQPQFMTAALARSFVRRNGGGSLAVVLVTAATYVATEAVAPKLFGDTLGYPLYGSVWLRQGADVTGVPGLTFVIVLVNACVAAAVQAYRRRGVREAILPVGVAVAVVGVLASYGAWRCHMLARRPSGAGITVGLVQADLDHYDRMAADIGRFETVRLILDQHVERSAPALARDDLALLVWPETVYPTTFGKPKSDDGAAFDREIVDFVARAGVPLIFGAYDTDGEAEFNAAFFLTPDAGGAHPLAIYRKTRLFPLTERVPAFLDSAWLRRAMPWLGTWRAGEGAKGTPMTVGARTVAASSRQTIHVVPLICYDVLDPELARAAVRAGADVIVTLSNDSWFAVGPGPQLHMLGAAFRSIETRRPQLRATNTGISAVIDATGTVTASAGVDARATLIETIVPERDVTTMVVRFGEWINAVAALWAASILVANRIQRRNRGIS